MDDKATVLILSFSDIANDARVKKQVRLFADSYRVVTCGFGDQVMPGVEHLRLDQVAGRAWPYVDAVLLRLRLYALDYRFGPYARAARRALSGRSFDVVIANDIDTLGVAVDLFGGERVHSDLHEYFPGLHDDNDTWRRVRKPYAEWILRSYCTRAASATTVSDTIARRYLGEFGIDCGVVRNAAPLMDFEPGQVGAPIRMVHSGGAAAERRIEVMMEAAARTETDLVFDLYLTQQHTPYAQRLRDLADELGDRVTVHPPVPQSQLVETLNGYDVGIHILPATNTNNELALPNKFFDYVQARLGMVIGPTADMAALLDRYELGLVADSFEVESVVRALDSLVPERVELWKRNADAASEECSAEAQQHTWAEAVAAIAGKR